MNNLIKSFFSLLLLIGFTASVSAADYNLRMTMNSNDKDEDYDQKNLLNNHKLIKEFVNWLIGFWNFFM